MDIAEEGSAARLPPRAEATWTERLPEAFHWPGGADLAVWVVLNVEWFPFDGGGMALFESTKHLRPDVLNYAWRDYGTRVGLSRMIKAFAARDIPVTVALNAAVCDQAPHALAALSHVRAAYMGHGWTNARRLSDMTPQEQLSEIARVKERIRKATGKDPLGWLGPGAVEQYETVEALAAAGYTYVCDWCNDDLPYRFETKSGLLWAAPYSMEINDGVVLHENRDDSEAFRRRIVDQANGLLADPGPRAMAIALHPFLTGQPFRLAALLQAIDELRERRDVWFCTGDELIHTFSQGVS